MTILNFIFLFILILVINQFLLKKNFLLSLTGDKHQKFSSVYKIPLTGGLFIFFGSILFLKNDSLMLVIFSGLILILGIFSDLKLIKSALLRFFLQIIIVLFFLIFNDIQITNTRVLYLDNLLQNNLFNYLFVTFCVLIVINGSNFIDGMNTLNVGYYFILSSVIYFLDLNDNIILNRDLIINILILLFFVYLLNFFNKIYLGDSGSYFIGFIYAIFLINIYFFNQFISPFFIILLLWYPCYENLFSIVRKYNLNLSPMKPDTNHFHQLIFFIIKKKYKLKTFTSNIFTAHIINFYNLIIFCIGFKYLTRSEIQIFLILFNIFFYTFIYTKMLTYKYRKGA
jgi:UDP-N-acetylmuramyl pentapeptide phosphotransferase/UDP-N-acetylglucosamine-1-phosphate transferase